MRLLDHDLRQMDEDYLNSLDLRRLRLVSMKLLADLKDARERLNRNSQNSSVPPSSLPAYLGAPMGAEDGPDTSGEDDPADKEIEPKAGKKTAPKGNDSETVQTADGATVEKEPAPDGGRTDTGSSKRKVGKQKGAPGHGRTQVIPPHRTETHRASQCTTCGEQLPATAPFVASTGFYVIDIKEQTDQQWGVELECVLHHYGETRCGCGHRTLVMPGRGDSYPSTDSTSPTMLNEWRLIGPRLASFIVFLTYRMRLSRARVQEFLQEWFGLKVATGTIDHCLRESALAALPIYLMLLEAVSKEPLVNVDETPWREKGKVPWLWVFISATMVLFVIDKRQQEVALQVLTASFAGWLMSDGLILYRMFPKRLRCLAHLIRKARGLAESLTEEAQECGETALAVLKTVLDYRAGVCSLETVRNRLAAFHEYCTLVADNTSHQKTMELTKEFLNDWDTIWKVVGHPELPATNNLAERILRHWVIARQISHGTRTEEGSRAVAILASIIETCRLRGAKIWDYLTQVIRAGRRGESPPGLPVPVLVG